MAAGFRDEAQDTLWKIVTTHEKHNPLLLTCRFYK